MEEVNESIIKRDVSLILTNYNDIFSSFDPRPYSERALSQDFLEECKRAVKENEEKFELIFLMPHNLRNHNQEQRIVMRLKEHFHKHFLINKKEIDDTRKEGALWFMIGAIMLISLVPLISIGQLWATILEVIIQPAGWFTCWSGLDKIFFNSKQRENELRFNRKMAQAIFNFKSY